MKRLLYHCTSHKVDVLHPDNYNEGAICLSEDVFVGTLGQYLYIFDYEVMNSHFRLDHLSSGGQAVTICFDSDVRYRYESQRLGHEYRIYSPIDVSKFAIGVARNFNVLQGILQKELRGRIVYSDRVDLECDRMLG